MGGVAKNLAVLQDKWPRAQAGRIHLLSLRYARVRGGLGAAAGAHNTGQDGWVWRRTGR